MAKTEEWYSLAPRDVSSSPKQYEKKPSTAANGEGESAFESAAALPSSDKKEPASEQARPQAAEARDSSASRAADSIAADRTGGGQESEEEAQLRFDDEGDEDTSGGTAQERWQRTNAYMRDVQQAFRSRPAVRVQSNERYMKLLLVGEPGLGKELFTKNIFAPYCADNDLPVSSCEAATEPTTFQHNPAEFCTEIVVDVDDGRTKIHYLIQDTPGTHLAGADRCILRHVVQQSQEYMAREEDPRRVVPLSALPDCRVDACLYFLSPHFLKPQDVSLISRLSEYVPVIPLIAKADALTTAELVAYRTEVREKLQQAGEHLGRPVMHTFSDSELEAAGAVRPVPPFAIISSNEVDHEVGSHWFTRTFPWGRCEVMSSNHSDLPALKSLLFECCFEAIKAATESRFYAARESYLTTRALSRALSSAELPGSSPIKAPPLPAAPSSSRTATPFAAKGPQQKDKAGPGLSGGSSWRWVGLTVGALALAVGVQLAMLRMYARNSAHMRSLLETYRRQAAAEQQAIAGLVRSLGVD